MCAYRHDNTPCPAATPPKQPSTQASHSASGPGTVELVENGNGLQPGQLADVRFVVAVPGQGAERQLRAALSALSGGDVTLYDAAAGAQGEPTWGSLDDVVMGGASRSAWSWEDAGGEGGDRPAGVFSGEVTTANSGGFASVRMINMGARRYPEPEGGVKWVVCVDEPRSGLQGRMGRA